MKFLLVLIFSTLSLTLQAAPKSFSSAKNTLAKKIYTDQDDTFYCGCDMVYVKTSKGKDKLTPDPVECGFKFRKQLKRSSRIEWEHVVPAWYFGHQMQCWQEGGRKLCGKQADFKKMESNLHNLVPAIGEVNGDRSNFSLTSFSASAKYKDQYGQCDMTVDFKQKKAMPPKETFGDIARIYFYMADKYNLRLSKQDVKVYTAWNNLDPVSDNERRIHDLKAIQQGEVNPFVTGEKTPADYK